MGAVESVLRKVPSRRRRKTLHVRRKAATTNRATTDVIAETAIGSAHGGSWRGGVA